MSTQTKRQRQLVWLQRGICMALFSARILLGFCFPQYLQLLQQCCDELVRQLPVLELGHIKRIAMQVMLMLGG